jgi:uncharacterized protein with ParB-like and HNH nuclease domain
MKIGAGSKTLEQIFYGLDKKYYIPKYQRDYSWTASDELKELWSDVLSAYIKDKDYFMGTILLAKHDNHADHFDIVDGQQRTVSFMLLLSVIRDYAKLVQDGEISNKLLSSEGGNEEDVADDLYSEVRGHIGKKSNYLRVTNKDQPCFEQALDIKRRELKTEISKSTNRIIKGKRFFQDEIQKEFFERINSLDNLKRFYEFCITKLQFVTIVVEDDYDAYVIFESLNSKGMDLSVADLLKNKVLNNIKDDRDQEIILNDWDDLVKTIQDIPSNFVDYIRVYWNAYKGSDTTKSTLYKSIRSDIGVDTEKTKDLVNMLSSNAVYFDKLKNKSNLNWPKINLKEKWAGDVSEMNLLGYTIHLPCFLYALKNNEDILPELARKSKTLLFRWVTICDFGVGEVDTLFKDILKAMKAGRSNDEIILLFDDLFKKVDDNVFREAFRNFESENSKIMKYIMTKLHIIENGDSLVPNFLQVDLEHIIPQQLDIWRKSGKIENFSMPYKRWVYSIGNVCLWEKNKNRSQKNEIFDKKKIGYSESIFPETKELAKLSDWNEDSLKKRSEVLADKALDAWSL